MVNPAWFFSTLAQAVAAAIGFVIAFTASIYTIRRSRTQERVHRLQEDIGEVHRTYSKVIKEMSDNISDNFNYDVSSVFNSGNQAEFSELSEDQKRMWILNQNSTVAATIWVELKILHTLLQSVPSSSNHERISDEIDDIRHLVRNLKIELDRDRPAARRFYEEFTGKNKAEYDDDRFHYDDIFSHNHNMKNVLENANIGNKGHDRQIRGWMRVFYEFEAEFDEIISRRGIDWLSNNEYPTTNVLRRSVILFAVGVVVPIFFLISVPVSTPILSDFRITGLGIPIIQFTLLFVVLWQSWVLFGEINGLIEDG